MARGEAPDIKITEGIQPRSTMVDTYVRPATPAPSPLHDTARALRGLSADLDQAFGQITAEFTKNDKLKGEAEFVQGNQEGYAEAVRSGQSGDWDRGIPAFASPTFVQGYKEAAGTAAGLDLNNKFGVEYAKWADKNSEDPNAFGNFFNGFIKENVQTKDPRVLAGLAPTLRAMQSHWSAQHLKDRQEATLYQAETGYTALIGAGLKELSASGKGREGGLDLAAGASLVNQTRQKAIGTGLERSRVDKLAIDAVTSAAIANKDLSLLNVLDQTTEPGETALSATAYGRDKQLTTRHTIIGQLHTEQTQATAEKVRLDKIEKEAVTREIVHKMINREEVPDELLQRGERIDGSFRVDVMGMRKKILDDTVTEDPAVRTRLYADIISSGDGHNKLFNAMRMGLIKDPETIKKVSEFADMVEKQRSSDAPILKSSGWDLVEKNIRSQFADPAFKGQIFKDEGLTPAGLAALLDARRQAIVWAATNPNASRLDQEDFIQKMAKSYADSLGKDKTGSPVYTQPTEAAQSRATVSPQGPQLPGNSPQLPQQPTPNPALPGGATSTTPKAAKTWNEQVIEAPTPPKVKDLILTPKQRQDLEARSKRLGVDPQLFIDKTHQNYQMLKQRMNADPALGKRSEVAPNEQVQNASLPMGLGNLGGFDLSGLPEEALGRIREAVAPYLKNLNPISTANAMPSPVELMDEGRIRSAQEGLPDMSNTRRIAQIDATPVRGAVEQVAMEMNFPADMLKTIVSIESSGNPKAGAKGSYKGLLQLNSSEWKQYGDGTDIMDPIGNLRAGVRSMMAKARTFERDFGRRPSATELYLMHQQGEAGLRAHAKNLDQPAYMAMLGTGEGKRKGERWAKAAIWGNVPTDVRGRFGSVDKMTSREFIGVWTSKVEGIPLDQAIAQVGKMNPKEA